jgi:hypothetical protein
MVKYVYPCCVGIALAFSISCKPNKVSESLAYSNKFELGVVRGVIEDERIEEASGLAESLANPGLLWTHNDSGDEARLFLIDKAGIVKATIWLKNIHNRDWEDIAVGPGPDEGKTYVYIGEIGDNNAESVYKYIYRIEEPVIDVTVTTDTTIERVAILKFKYPDGERDAESLLLDPLTRDLFIISKRELRSNVYRLPYPQSTDEPMVAELALEKIEFEQASSGDTINTDDGILIKGYHPKFYYQIVAADISADGSEVLVKSYSSVYYWKRAPHETIVDVLKRPCELLPYEPEPQGEAIAFDHSGTGYYTLNERMRGKAQRLIFYKRANEKTQP